MPGRKSTNRGSAAPGAGPGLTATQRRAVESQEPRICVRAGPGSGKTRVLVHRVSARVLSGQLKLARVLAITFTENAAAEMKERIAKQFEAAGREDLQRDVESAYISTIHGFCSRLLHENAVVARVDPRFQVLDEIHSALLKQLSIDRILDSWKAAEPDGFGEFIRHFRGQEYAQLLVTLFDRIRALGCDPADQAVLLAPVAARPVAETLRALQLQAKKVAAGATADRRLAAGASLALLTAVDAGADAAAVLAAVMEARSALGRNRKEGICELKESLAEFESELFDFVAAPHRRQVARLLGDLARDYSAAKTGLAALDFDDLEKCARDLLRGDAALLARVRSRFDEILIDEYQDTSPAQDDIIRRLAAGRTLFVVGDPAQSIYAFRSAKPEYFDRMWTETPKKGQFDLRDDFRSRPEVIALVNQHFTPRFAATQTAFEPLTAGTGFAPKSAPSVELLITCAEGEKHVSETRPLEAAEIGRRIREWVEPEPGEPLRITNPQDGKFGQPIAYSGIALLFRSTTDIQMYERALEAEGIPYFSETGRGFYQAREVRDIASMLKVAQNSRNEIAVAAALRSPLFGLSDDALLLLTARARLEKGAALCDALPAVRTIEGLPVEDLARLEAFESLLLRLRQLRPHRPLGELINEIVHSTGYEATLLLEPNGRRKVSNVRKLADIATSLETGGFENSLNEFIRALDDFQFREVREAEAQVDSSEDAVRLMTMHGAKGLEFPIVVIPDLSRGGYGSRDYLDFDEKHGLGVQFSLAPPGGKQDPKKTPTLERIRKDLDASEKAEDYRVQFVAFTRAQEHLLLSGCATRKNGGVKLEKSLKEIAETAGIGTAAVAPGGEWQRQAIGAGGAYEVAWRAVEGRPGAGQSRTESIVRRYRAAIAAGAPLNLAADATIEREVDAAVRKALAPMPEYDGSDFTASATDVMEFNTCARRYFLGRYLGHDTKARSFRVAEEQSEERERYQRGGDEFTASDLGRAVHALLSQDERAIAEDVPAALRPEAERLARVFWQSDYHNAADADARPTVLREYSLFTALDGRILRGNLDLLQLDREGKPALLLDYKTNAINANEVPELTGHYRPQMLLYALLIEAAFGERPREVVLYFLQPGVASTIEVTDAALQEARALLSRFFEAQQKLDFPATAAPHCRFCRFNGALCADGWVSRK